MWIRHDLWYTSIGKNIKYNNNIISFIITASYIKKRKNFENKRIKLTQLSEQHGDTVCCRRYLAIVIEEKSIECIIQ